MLRGQLHGRNELVGEALVFATSKLQEDVVIIIENEAIFGTVDAKFMNRRFHLRRKRKIRSRVLLVRNYNAKLIDNVGFTNAFENRAHKSVSDDVGVVGCQELCDSCDAVANDVLE